MIGLLKHSSNFYLQPLSRNINYFYRHGRNLLLITAGLILRSLLRKELFPKSVIPECFYRESRRDRNWTSDPFDVAQGRGEHSRTTIKTFGGDAVGIKSHGMF